MKNSCNKGLLIPWLLKALDEQLYTGLKWSDKKKNIFYIIWTHKSAEHWSTDVLEPFKAWAAHKGKLAGKNEKQLKATFRCALNSKKEELREVHRNRTQRFWQFLDPKCGEIKSGNKKRRKSNNKPVDAVPVGESNDSITNSFMECSSAASSCCEDFFKSSEEKNSKKKKRRVNRKIVDDGKHSASPLDVGNTFTNYLPAVSGSIETENSTTEKLPPFQTFCSSQPLTPPYQDNEIPFGTPEHNTDYNNLLIEASRLTPPLDTPPKDNQNKSRCDTIHQFSTEFWHPNCWPIPPVQQEITGFSHFFPNDFDDLGKSANNEEINVDKMDFLEMDHCVPVMHMNDNTLFRNGVTSYPSKPLYEGNRCEQVKLDDDYLFTSDVHPDEERIFEELIRIPMSSEIGTFNYCS